MIDNTFGWLSILCNAIATQCLLSEVLEEDPGRSEIKKARSGLVKSR